MLSEETALIIAEETWEQQGDIRDLISLPNLVKKHDGPGEIAEIIKTLANYGYATSCIGPWIIVAEIINNGGEGVESVILH